MKLQNQNGRSVTVGSTTYLFYNCLEEHPALLASFNTLCESTFGISFSEVGSGYHPHVLVLDGAVCANVSVNFIPFLHKSTQRSYVQLGTVMTSPALRRRGLSNWLLQWVLGAYLPQCDALYLYANDSVLDFYPKYGFVPQTETSFQWSKPTPCASLVVSSMEESASLQPLHPQTHRSLLWEKYAQGNVFSSFSMVENRPIPTFYWDGPMAEHLYFLPAFGIVVIAQWVESTLYCHEILGETTATLDEILQTLCKHETATALLGFTPRNLESLQALPLVEENSTLFLHKTSENIFAQAPLQFPVLSHA